MVRAATLLAEHGAEHTTLVHGDGQAGVPELAPFDRLVTWTTAPLLPDTWVAQVRPGGKIVAPLSLTPLSKTGAGVVVEIDGHGAPTAKALFAARYVEMHTQPVTQWQVPPYGADIVRCDPGGRTWWLSAEHFRRPADRPIGAALLDRLAEHPVRGDGPLVGGEQAKAFAAWLGAVQPTGLTTAALGNPCWRIGLTAPDGAALLATLGGPDLVTVGGDGPKRDLAALVQRWRGDGCPDVGDLIPCLERAVGGWAVRAAVRPRTRSTVD